jgi:hypothetical protein
VVKPPDPNLKFINARYRFGVRRLAVVVAAVAALLVPSLASGSPNVQYGIQDDAWLAYGPGTLQQRIAKLEALGTQIVRYNVRWDQVALRRPKQATSPADPAYRWQVPDAVLQGLHNAGLDVVVGLLGTPGWANGGQATNYAPKLGADFGNFAYAAARRYPWVRKWLIWNEPNQRRWLIPDTPAVYVTRLLNPAYAAIHRATPAARVGGGVTAPRGNLGGVAPVNWIAGMKAAGARLDAYAHHPYPSSKAETPITGGCDHCLTITMATLPRLLTTVARAFGPKPIWLTEYGYQTNPPDRLLGVSPALQARYLGQGALRAFQAPRVEMLIHYLYRDEPDVARFQSGLVYLNNSPKPALEAFQLPLAQVDRSGASVDLWGEVRPGSGRRVYRLQLLVGGAWRWLGPLRTTTPRGFFYATVQLRAGTVVRAVDPVTRTYGAPVLVT